MVNCIGKTLLSILAVSGATAAAGAVTPRPRVTTGDVVTVAVPPGYGAAGTIVVDTDKAARYLREEAGIDVDKMMDYLQNQLSPVQKGVEYVFPQGSGLEKSSVTFDLDFKLVAHDDGGDTTTTTAAAATNNNNNNNNPAEAAVEAYGHLDSAHISDCDKCWVTCVMLSWFPPAWVM